MTKKITYRAKLYVYNVNELDYELMDPVGIIIPAENEKIAVKVAKKL